MIFKDAMGSMVFSQGVPGGPSQSASRGDTSGSN